MLCTVWALGVLLGHLRSVGLGASALSCQGLAQLLPFRRLTTFPQAWATVGPSVSPVSGISAICSVELTLTLVLATSLNLGNTLSGQRTPNQFSPGQAGWGRVWALKDAGPDLTLVLVAVGLDSKAIHSGSGTYDHPL